MKNNINIDIFEKEINETYQKYNFLYANGPKLKKLIKEMLINIINQTNEKNITKKVYIDKLEKSLDTYIKDNQKNQDKISKMLNNYINKNIKETDKNLSKLMEFINKYNFEINPETWIDLINNNKIVSQILDKLTKISTNIIEIDDLTSNLLEMYCQINNIDLYEEENSKGYFNEYQLRKKDDTMDCLEQYFKDINKHILTPEEEIELAKRIESGDQSAKNILIEHNLKWVIKVAKKYQNRGLELSDLIQEGNIGLMKAVEKYDYRKGYRFTTYATHWIDQTIGRAVCSKGTTIRLPIHINEKVKKLEKIKYELSQELNREPTKEELAEKLEISVNKVEKLESYKDKKSEISLNKYIGDSEDTQLEEIVSVEEESLEDKCIKANLPKEMSDFLKKCNLTEKELFVINYRMGFNGEPKSLKEIGDMLGLTRERTRQIESIALNKMRRSKNCESLIDYTESPSKAQRNLQEFQKTYYKRSRINKKFV